MSEERDPSQVQKDAAYWRANKRLIMWLMAVWLIVPLGCSVLFVEWFNQFTIGSVPLGFWLGQMGSILVFIALIGIYVWRMGRLDKKHAEETHRDH